MIAVSCKRAAAPVSTRGPPADCLAEDELGTAAEASAQPTSGKPPSGKKKSGVTKAMRMATAASKAAAEASGLQCLLAVRCVGELLGSARSIDQVNPHGPQILTSLQFLRVFFSCLQMASLLEQVTAPDATQVPLQYREYLQATGSDVTRSATVVSTRLPHLRSILVQLMEGGRYEVRVNRPSNLAPLPIGRNLSPLISERLNLRRRLGFCWMLCCLSSDCSLLLVLPLWPLGSMRGCASESAYITLHAKRICPAVS